MDSKKQKMTDIVAKLLRQAEDVTGTPEELVFQAKAFELMAKYGLEMAMVEAHKGGLDTSDMPDAVRKTFPVKGKYCYQQLMLLFNIASALHCKTVYNTHNYYDEPTYYMLSVFGVQRHIDRVETLWNILQPQMVRQAGVVKPTHSRGAGHTKSFRRSWIAGFGSAIGERIRAEENKVIEAAGGGALVLYKSDVERAEIALRKAYPRVRTSSRNSRINSEGYQRGRADGQRAAFNHSIAG